MSTNDPKYVRLSDRASNGTQVDLNTGWSISGMDVKEFPENKQAAAFVRTRITRNIIEPASKAEFEEVEEGKVRVSEIDGARQAENASRILARALGLPVATGGIQEAQLREAAKETRDKLVEARHEDNDGVDENRARRRAIIADRNGETTEGEGGDELPEDLDDLTVPDLKRELEARNLSVDGNKPDLVARLSEALDTEEDES